MNANNMPLDQPADDGGGPLPAITAENFWRVVQDPLTRERDPNRLMWLAERAMEDLQDPEMRVSASVVVTYRIVEKGLSRSYPNLQGLLDSQSASLAALEKCDKFGSVRWYLSGNLARSLLQLNLDDIASAKASIARADSKYDVALRLGQPFTNVVKAAAFHCALLALQATNEEVKTFVYSILSKFVHDANKTISNYAFTNRFAFEEVSFVFKMLMHISAVYFEANSSSNEPADIIKAQDWSVLGGEFAKAYTKRFKGSLRSTTAP